MKVCKNLSEVAAELKIQEWEVQKAYERTIGRTLYFKFENVIMNDLKDMVYQEGMEPIELIFKDITVFISNREYFLVDTNDNEDCREYILKYELRNYEWEVKTDDIVGVEKCKVIGIENTRMGIDRATVITESGTQLNRVVVFITDKEDEDYKQDGCIYFWEK